MQSPVLLTPFLVKSIMRAEFASDLESGMSEPCIVNMIVYICVHVGEQLHEV